MPLRIRTIGIAAATTLVASLVTAAGFPSPSSAEQSPAQPGQPSWAVATIGIAGQPDGGLAVQLSVPGQQDGQGLGSSAVAAGGPPAVVLGVPAPAPLSAPPTAAAPLSPGAQGVVVDLGVNGVHGLDLRGGGNGGGIVALQVSVGDRPVVSLGEPPLGGEGAGTLDLPGLSLDLGGLFGR